MEKLHFYIVDVFAEEKYSGNQLAVFMADDSLSTDVMQKIARETNFPETTFILSTNRRNDGYDVRIFTPGEEIPFAGHPTLGTSFVIRNEIIKKPVEKVILNLKVGQIPVTFKKENSDSEILWMKQIAPEFGPVYEREQIAKILSLSPEDIDDTFPVQAVSTGLPFVIVPVKDMKSLKKARISMDDHDQFVKDAWAKAFLFFCPECYENNQDLAVRMFAPYYRVPEDPATGSGNGCLAGFLVKQRYFGTNNIDICTAQGYEIDRPSTLYLKATERNGQIDISVGGKVIKIAEGDFV